MSKSAPPLWPPYARVPPFLPVPRRSRSDGWSVDRQGRFIGMLAQTGSVAAAARAAGKSRNAAYRLRRAADAEGFAAAWDGVLAVRAGTVKVAKWKVTPLQVHDWAIFGPVRITMRRGRFVRAERKPCNTALLRLLAQLDRGGACDAMDIW